MLKRQYSPTLDLKKIFFLFAFLCISGSHDSGHRNYPIHLIFAQLFMCYTEIRCIVEDESCPSRGIHKIIAIHYSKYFGQYFSEYFEENSWYEEQFKYFIHIVEHKKGEFRGWLILQHKDILTINFKLVFPNYFFTSYSCD